MFPRPGEKMYFFAEISAIFMNFMKFRQNHEILWHLGEFSEFHENKWNSWKLAAPTPPYIKSRLMFCTVSCDLGDMDSSGEHCQAET